LSPEALAERLQGMRDLQQQYFSDEERQAFFGDDEAEDRYTVARVAVWQDTQLNAPQKAQRLRDLQQTLPVHLQQRLTAADAVTDLRALHADWQARGGTPEELRAARVALVGEAAAERLEALDAQRAAWAQRVNDYRAAAARIEQDASLSPALRDQAVQQLRQSAFTPAEWPRLDAALQMAGMPGTAGP
jgi:lipase chaperone LimK